MKLLLDTHVWLWRLLEPDRLAEEAASALQQFGNELLLSPISVWETLVLAHKGRLELEGEPAVWVRRALGRTGLTMTPLTHAIAIDSEGLDELTSDDPADRFLVATARAHEATLVTADRRILAFDGVTTLAAA